jgi:hypothetical protein
VAVDGNFGLVDVVEAVISNSTKLVMGEQGNLSTLAGKGRTRGTWWIVCLGELRLEPLDHWW